MNFKSLDNKFLTVNVGVDLTEVIDNVICLLDPMFKNFPAHVTSGLRTAEHQLEIIKQKAVAHELDKGYPEILSATVLDQSSWINAWGKLLVLGEMVNPPVPAQAPFSYTKPNGQVREAGITIGVSDHMRGHAFDIGGDEPETRVIIEVAIGGKQIPIVDYLFEPTNNAVHVDCADSKLKAF